jgi:hypothetical protein
VTFHTGRKRHKNFILGIDLAIFRFVQKIKKFQTSILEVLCHTQIFLIRLYHCTYHGTVYAMEMAMSEFTLRIRNMNGQCILNFFHAIMPGNMVIFVKSRRVKSSRRGWSSDEQ